LGDTYRGFFKDYRDTSHYGVIEFRTTAGEAGISQKNRGRPHATEELEKMGALGRTDGKPVSFYIQVIPLGEKTAAKKPWRWREARCAIQRSVSYPGTP